MPVCADDSLSDKTIAAYEELIAAHGDAEPLRSSSEYDNEQRP